MVSSVPLRSYEVSSRPGQLLARRRAGLMSESVVSRAVSLRSAKPAVLSSVQLRVALSDVSMTVSICSRILAHVSLDPGESDESVCKALLGFWCDEAAGAGSDALVSASDAVCPRVPALRCAGAVVPIPGTRLCCSVFSAISRAVRLALRPSFAGCRRRSAEIEIGADA